jgi:translation initiation factor IF-2
MEIKIIHSDVGNITDSDLIFAQASQAIVIGYNVTTTATLQKKAELMKVVVKQYDIIYEFIDRLEKLALGLVEIEKKEVSIGKLNVLAVFFKRAKEMIIG